MKNFKLFIFSILSFLLYTAGVKAQSIQNITYGEQKTYRVDTSSDPTNPELGDQPDGTDGSTYTWSVYNTETPAVEITGDGTLTIDNQGFNVVTIDWGTTPAGTYTLKVVESVNSCTGDEKLITVNIRNVGMPTIMPADISICNTATAMFTIAGAEPGSTITYTIIGGTSTDDNPIAVNSNGEAIIAVTPTAGASEIIVTLTQMTLSNGNVIAIDPAISATTEITIIQTSDILFD